MNSNEVKTSLGTGIFSMTGFGSCEKILPGKHITVEIRTVNNRFCEIGMKIPREMNALEGTIRDRVRGRVSRGRVSLLITIKKESKDENPLNLDPAAAQACYAQLRELNTSLGHTERVSLEQLLYFKEYFMQESASEADATLQGLVLETLEDALQDLLAMRRSEGIALAQDLLTRLGLIETISAQIEKLAVDQPQLQMDRLRERLEMLAGAGPLDPGRLETELALLADRLDVTEECVRLTSHCQLFKKAMSGSEPPGKRLGFLLQEMNREVNTIGSKSALAEISHLTINIKEELERMREQIQNLE
jgi:uncharacterized protein (TIGR00255 family)